MRTLAGVIAALALAACGGSTKESRTRGPGPDHNPGDGTEISEGGSGGQGVDPAAPLSADECDTFTAHVIELNMVEMRAKLPPEEVPTDEQVAEIREKMSGDCLQFPRAVVECGMAATTIAEVAKCQDKAPEPGG